jgi:hypothetical protein
MVDAQRGACGSLGPRLSEWLAIGLLVLAIVVYHAFTIDAQSYFVDEVEELSTARRDFWESVFLPDSMPPLFTVTLRAWLLLSASDQMARWLSASLSALIVAGSWWLMRRRLGPFPSLTATGMLAFSPWHLFYAQLTRGYELLIVFGILTIGGFLVAVVRDRSKWWSVTGLACLLGMYTHYYFVMIPISLTIGWLCGRDWKAWKPMLLTWTIVGLLSLPLVVFLKSDFQYQHDLREPRSLSLAAAVYTYFSYFSGYSLGPSQRELKTLNSSQALQGAFGWLLVVSATSIPLAVLGCIRARHVGLLSYLIALLTIPLGLLAILGWVSGITYNARFVCWMVFPLSMLLGMGIQASERRGRLLAAFCTASIFVIFAIANYQRVFDARYQTEATRDIADYLRREGATGDSIFVVSDYIKRPLEYYLSEAPRLFELPNPGIRSIVIDRDEKLQDAIGHMRRLSTDRFWVVYSRPFHGDPDGLFWNGVRPFTQEVSPKFAGAVLLKGDRRDLPR